jgi:predicted component of type VI protein secretion system
MGKLVHFLANGTAREFRLDRERITIGRRPDNDICLPQAPVSGAHAAIVTVLADSFLEDLGSTNGTLINGKAVKKHFLRDRDEIDIGREILVYLADDGAKLDAPPRGMDRARTAAGGDGTDAGAASQAASAGGADGVPRGKRRSDGAAAPSAPVEAVRRPAATDTATDIERTGGEPAAEAPGSSASDGKAALPESPAESVPAIRVLTGARAGQLVALAKSATLVGRAGVQVAALQRTGDEIRVVPVEGSSPPSINGTPVAGEGQRLAAGDILEVAGSRLELVASASAAP